MTDEYAPPKHVVAEWKRQCDCCPECSPHPCDGVMAGGMCDNLSCECDDHEAVDELEADCHMMPDGYCMAAGSEYCEFECPNSNSFGGNVF